MKSAAFFLLLACLVFLSVGTIACGGGSNPPIPNPPSVTTKSLPNGTVGVAYSTTLQASGGIAPYHWSLIGTLPFGLSFNSNGAITSMPAFSGTSGSLFFQVTDSVGAVASATLSLTINAMPMPPAIITTSLPAGTVGVAYSTAVQVTGGTTPYTWKLKSGTLPAGLSLSASTGAITGTPTTPETSNDLIFQVSDATGLTAISNSLSIVINP